MAFGFFLSALALLPSPARAVDGDLDGIPDALELALAQRFFPTLNLHCGSYEGLAYGDRRQLYGHSVPGYTNSSNGKIPFFARPYNPGTGADCAEPFQCIEIRYGIAWNWDLGDNFGGGGHRGDSEMYAILVARKDTDGSEWGTTWAVAQNDVNQWRLMKEFMTAHLNTSGDSSSYRAHGNLGSATYQKVWCSEGKHGMYRTQSSCNNGGFLDADDCSDNRCDIRADVYQDVQNIGEPTVPLNRYIPYPGASKTTPPSGSYDVWGGTKFGDSGDYKSRLQRTLAWCSGPTYCVQNCGYDFPECAPGDRDAGGCRQDCGIETNDRGLLCESVQCY
jgi:hypothetical protein